MRIIYFSFFILAFDLVFSIGTENLSRRERRQLRDEAKEMFYHGYNAYMENAYPADELMPLSCKGRIRGITPSRGDMDDVLGNFSMTLVDTLDTLMILGNFKEFERAVNLTINNISFDNDIVVSVFEVNIRMIGGLLSAHILASQLSFKTNEYFSWYKGELLEMAKDLAYRLLPAFNTTTGIPHGKINLKYGMNDKDLIHSKETCTACAGTILLEFATLSRLTGDPIFETKAHVAMDSLWKLRNRGSDLMGTVLNVHSGDWIIRDSGVGAGIDSYYEYLLKSYILLGDDKYLMRFNRHYDAIMKYISEGPVFLDVLMHRPHAKTRYFMDALLAFWPGLQVLSGDLKPAVQTHEMLYQVMQMHNFIPEAFTVDFQVHWSQYPLRPEFIESTYFLYRATKDHHYLHVGKQMLKALQNFTKVPCGFAAVNDVRTGKHEDRMDSFVLSETIKYLYLLFADPQDIPFDIDEYIFTTEAHLLPLTIAQMGGDVKERNEYVMEINKNCPNLDQLYPYQIRKPLKNFIVGKCPRKSEKSRLRASEFKANSPDHIQALYEMGISMVDIGDGKIRLFQKYKNAKSQEDGEVGLAFMQEMLDLTQTSKPVDQLRAIVIETKNSSELILMAGPGHFGKDLKENDIISGKVRFGEPVFGCSELHTPQSIRNTILVLERGNCTFVSKAREAQKHNIKALIICDNNSGSTSDNNPMFAMSGDGNDNVNITAVFIYHKECLALKEAVLLDNDVNIKIMHMDTLKNEIKSNKLKPAL